MTKIIDRNPKENGNESKSTIDGKQSTSLIPLLDGEVNVETQIDKKCDITSSSSEPYDIENVWNDADIDLLENNSQKNLWNENRNGDRAENGNEFLTCQENDISPEQGTQDIFLVELNGIKREIKGIMELSDNDNTILRRLTSILDQLYRPAVKESKPKLGFKGLNDLLFNEAVTKLPNRKLRKLLEAKKKLKPLGYLGFIDLLEKVVLKVAKKVNKKIGELTDEDFDDVELFAEILGDYRTVSSKIHLEKIYEFMVPFHKIKLHIGQSDDIVTFDHPAVNKVVKERKKKGTNVKSINNNVVNQVKPLLEWLCKVRVEFSHFNINTIPVWKISSQHLTEYRAFLLRQIDRGERTELGAKKHLQYIKGFFSELYALGIIQKDIVRKVTNLNADDYIYREIPSNEDISRFFEVVQTYSKEPQQDTLAYSLMLQLGFRRSEVARLAWEGINMSTKTISFLRKGGEYSILPMPAAIYSMLSKIEAKANGFVFHNKSKPANFEGYLYRMYKLYAYIAGWNHIEGGVHIFRHTFITNLALNRNVPLEVVQMLGDHESPNTTAKYIHIRDAALRQGIDKINFGVDK